MSKPVVKNRPLFSKFFFKHFTRNLIFGIAAAIVILLIGIFGLRHFEGSNWVDAYANSAMIISGVGMLTTPITQQGKLFAATFSIIGGGAFLLIIAVVFAPIFHWLIQRMKIEDREHL